jgi:hypothetical protein
MSVIDILANQIKLNLQGPSHSTDWPMSLLNRGIVTSSIQVCCDVLAYFSRAE